jgi:hypothetical protein
VRKTPNPLDVNTLRFPVLKTDLEDLEESFTEHKNPFFVFATNPHPAFKAKLAHDMEIESTDDMMEIDEEDIALRLQLQGQLDKIWSTSADPSHTHFDELLVLEKTIEDLFPSSWKGDMLTQVHDMLNLGGL